MSYLFSFTHLNSIAFTFLPMVDCPSFLGFLHSGPCNFLFTLRVSASEESVLKAVFIFFGPHSFSRPNACKLSSLLILTTPVAWPVEPQEIHLCIAVKNAKERCCSIEKSTWNQECLFWFSGVSIVVYGNKRSEHRFLSSKSRSASAWFLNRSTRIGR